MRRLFRLANRMGALGLALLLAGCSHPGEAIPLGNGLAVLGPDVAFERALKGGRLPTDWAVVGKPPKGSLAVTVVDGSSALRVQGGGEGFAILRRTRASLLATPYLSWAWNAAPARSGAHPVSIVIGLRDRRHPVERSWWRMGEAPASAERLISIVWAETALGRGTVVGPIRRKGEAERADYIARGGQEQGGRWWIDTVDLSLIHHQVWPKDDPAQMDVVLIGVAASPADAPATMNVAQIRLAR